MSLLALALDLLAASLSPERCAACDAGVRRGRAFCPPCAATVVGPPVGDPRVAAVGLFGGALADAVRRLKYEDHPELARPLGDLLARAGARLAAGVDVIVPVPLASSRLAERGYNQAGLLASRAAARWGLPALARGLRRVRATSPLAKQGAHARKASIEGAFVALHPGPLRGQRVLLVDDVRTTGATLRAAEQALRAAGATVAGCAVVALTERLVR